MKWYKKQLEKLKKESDEKNKTTEVKKSSTPTFENKKGAKKILPGMEKRSRPKTDSIS